MAEADKNFIESLSKHTGMSASKMATKAGLTPSTLTRPLHQPVKHRLSVPTLEKLKITFPDFPGFDDSHLQSNAAIVGLEGASLEEPEENLPVWGTMLGAAQEYDGEAIEQTMLNTGDVLEYVARPTILKRKEVAYALYVQGSSMHPALKEGEMRVAVKGMPIRREDNVVVYLKAKSGDDDDNERVRAVLVKEYVRATAHYYELRQYQPDKEFRIPREEVLRIDRILTTNEMLATR